MSEEFSGGIPLANLYMASQASIRETLTAVEAGTCEVALVLDEQTRLVGAVTDGDIRRAGHAATAYRDWRPSPAIEGRAD